MVCGHPQAQTEIERLKLDEITCREGADRGRASSTLRFIALEKPSRSEVTHKSLTSLVQAVSLVIDIDQLTLQRMAKEEGNAKEGNTQRLCQHKK